MSNPNIKIPVDLTNPGQFFACCGLLELASRLSEHAEGWFEEGVFQITNAPADTIQQFLKAIVTPILDNTGDDEDEDDSENGDIPKTVPLRIEAPFNLRLDWWRDPAATTVAKLKTWSAGQKVLDLFNGTTKTKPARKGPKSTYMPSMRDHLGDVVNNFPNDWLRETIVSDSPMPYCYDSRLSRKAVLDAGHYHFGELAFSPSADVLCHVAFQRFRPLMIEQWTRNRYNVWCKPLQICVAPVAVLGMLPSVISRTFEFPIKPCDSAGRYKLIGHAQPVRSIHA